MTEIAIADDKLVLTVRGFDVILALKHHLEVPLAHVARVEVGVAAEARERLRESLRMPGTHLPGIITAGSYVEHGRWMFWNIHRGDHAITLWLRHDRFDALVVDVADPAAEAARITTALESAH